MSSCFTTRCNQFIIYIADSDILLIELVCNLEHRNMDMIMFSQMLHITIIIPIIHISTAYESCALLISWRDKSSIVV